MIKAYTGPWLIALVAVVLTAAYSRTFPWDHMHGGDRIAFNGLLLALAAVLVGCFQWALMIRQDRFMTRSATMDLTFLNDQIMWSQRKTDANVVFPLEIHNRGNRGADKLYINIAMPVGAPSIASPPHPQGIPATLKLGGVAYNLYSELYCDPVFPR